MRYFRPLVVLVLLLFAVNAAAQTATSGSMSGSVIDAQSQVVPGADVILTNEHTQEVTANSHQRSGTVFVSRADSRSVHHSHRAQRLPAHRAPQQYARVQQPPRSAAAAARGWRAAGSCHGERRRRSRGDHTDVASGTAGYEPGREPFDSRSRPGVVPESSAGCRAACERSGNVRRQLLDAGPQHSGRRAVRRSTSTASTAVTAAAAAR